MSDRLSVELNIARKKLSDVLGEDMKLYLQFLKSWFKQKMTREDFDHEARILLKPESAHLHNQFLLAILTKCQSLGSPVLAGESTQTAHSRHHKRLKTKTKPFIEPSSIHQRFMPADALCQTPQVQLQFPEQDDSVPEFAVHDLLLPDTAMVHGRLIVSAWEFGLDSVQDDAVQLVSLAVEAQLKSILTAVVMMRKGYRIRNGCFHHGFGTRWPTLDAVSSVLSREFADHQDATTVTSHGSHVPTIKPSVELAQRDAAVHLASVPTDYDLVDLLPINLFDIRDALQTLKCSLPSHTIYTLNMERVLCRMSHDSVEELEQDEIHRQEKNLRRELIVRRTPSDCLASSLQ